MRSLFLFLCFSLIYTTTALAERRVALVIGNSDYKHVSALSNPVNDAELMARSLRKINFEVIVAKDLTQKGMKRAISRYARKIFSYGEDTLGLVFYAGHGVQVSGLNYLVPVDAEIHNEADVPIESVAANDLLYAIGQAGNRVNIIIFDACRNNPYRSLFRSNSAGLAHMTAPRGSLIAFATAPGTVASEGRGNNSPFTAALAKHIVTPGITIERVLKRVGKDVLRSTAKKQRPWWNRDIYEDLYLAGFPKISIPTPQKAKPAKVAKIKTGTNPDEFIRKIKNLPQIPKVQSPKSEPKYRSQRLPLPQKQAKAQKLPLPEKKAVTNKALGLFSELRHGHKFQDCPACPKMIIIKGGSFLMGSSEKEKGRTADEGPRRKVNVRKFAVGQFAVTFEEWDACVKDGGCNNHHPSDQGWGRGKRPVINVSWHDAQSYVKWLRRKTGGHYRLLTEAEWEYAASARTSTPFWWGKAISPKQANYNGSFTFKGGGLKGLYRKQTVPVDSFQPNPWGLYNVHGNVWEWVEDCWHKNYKNAPTNGRAWKLENNGNCSLRVLRGGSWFDLPNALRTRLRLRYQKDFRSYYYVGFRVARSLGEG